MSDVVAATNFMKPRRETPFAARTSPNVCSLRIAHEPLWLSDPQRERPARRGSVVLAAELPRQKIKPGAHVELLREQDFRDARDFEVAADDFAGRVVMRDAPDAAELGL